MKTKLRYAPHLTRRMTASIGIAVFLLVPSLCQGQENISVSVDEFVNSIRSATALCIGQLEIVGFPRGNLTIGRAQLGSVARGNSFRFSLQFSGSNTARFYIYANGVDRQYKIGDTCNASEDARKKALMTGRVSEAVILGYIQEKQGAIGAIRVPRLTRKSGKQTDGLSLIASDLTPPTHALLGGSLDLGPVKASIENPDDDLEVDDSKLEGSFRVGSPAAKLTVAVGLKGDEQRRASLEFRTENGQKAEFKIDLKSGAMSFENGNLVSQEFSPPTSASNASLGLGRLRFSYSSVHAQHASLTAKEGVLTAGLSSATFAATGAEFAAMPKISVHDSVPINVAELSGTPDPVPSGLELNVQVLHNLIVVSTDTSVDGGPIHVQGSGKIEASLLNEDTVDGAIILDSASVHNFGGTGEAAKLAALTIKGKSTASTYSGSVSGKLKQLRIGKTLLSSDDGNIQGQFDSAGDLPLLMRAGRGSFSIIGPTETDPAYGGDLTTASLQGLLSPTKGTLAFAGKKIAIDVQNLKADEGKVFGGIPSFDAGPMKFTNNDPVSVNENAAIGSLDSATKTFGIKGPQVWDATKALQLPLGSDLTSPGETALKTLLATGDLFPTSGIFSIDNINISPPSGISSITFRISDVDVEVKYLKIAHLELRPSLEIENLAGKADLLLNGVELGIGHVGHDKNPKFHGTGVEPVKAASLSGGIRVSRDPVQFVDLGIHNADFKLNNADYSTPDGIQFRAGAVDLNLETLTEAEAKGNLQITEARVHATGSQNSDATVKTLTLQFSGTKDNPLANGNVRFDTVDVVSDSGLQVDNCGNNYLPARISVQAGGLAGPVSISQNKVKFLLAANDAHIQLFMPTQLWQCEWDQKMSDAVTAPFTCCDWCVLPVCNCHPCQIVIIPEIDIHYQMTVLSLQATGMVTQLKLEPDPGNGVKVCEGHLLQLDPPLVVGGIAPTVRGGNVAAEAVRTFMAAAGVEAGTIIGNSLGSWASLVSLTHIGNSFYLKGACD